jgi:hypothetical protein
MTYVLSLRKKMALSDGPEFGTGPAFSYEVIGMPPSHAAQIYNSGAGNPNRHEWKFQRTKGGVEGNWSAEYPTAEDALAALQKEVDGEVLS